MPPLGLSEFGRIVTGLKADFFQGFHRWLLVKEEQRRVQIGAVLSIDHRPKRARDGSVDR